MTDDTPAPEPTREPVTPDADDRKVVPLRRPQPTPPVHPGADDDDPGPCAA